MPGKDPTPTIRSIDWAKWLSLVISLVALSASSYQFYLGSLREVHDFRAVEERDGVIVINAGNRTEVLASASRVYAPPPTVNRPREGTPPVGPFVFKPGDAQFISLPQIGDDVLLKDMGPTQRRGYSFTILDTRAGKNRGPTVGTEVFNWDVEIFPDGGSGGAGHDLGYVDLYTGRGHK